METKICVFEENSISFVLDKENKMMVNATEMAKVYDKKVEAFMRNEETKVFISECLKSENSRFIPIEKEEDLVISRQKSGTWMHRILALKFAAWLNPRFELWVYSTIEKLMFGKHVEREKSLERSLSLQNEMKTLAGKPNKSGEDFNRYLTIEQELGREKAIRKRLTVESVSEMRGLFDEQEE